MWSTICWNPQSGTIFFCQSAVHRFFSNRPHFFKSPHSISFLNPTPVMSKLIHSSVTTEKFCSPCRLFVQKSELMILLQYSSPKLKKKTSHTYYLMPISYRKGIKEKKNNGKIDKQVWHTYRCYTRGPRRPRKPRWSLDAFTRLPLKKR